MDASRYPWAGKPGRSARRRAWWWGRAGDDTGGIELVGDPAWADYLRRLLAVVTQ